MDEKSKLLDEKLRVTITINDTTLNTGFTDLKGEVEPVPHTFNCILKAYFGEKFIYEGDYDIYDENKSYSDDLKGEVEYKGRKAYLLLPKKIKEKVDDMAEISYDTLSVFWEDLKTFNCWDVMNDLEVNQDTNQEVSISKVK